VANNTPSSVTASLPVGVGPKFLQYPIVVGSSIFTGASCNLFYIIGGDATNGFTTQDVNLTAGMPTNVVQLNSAAIAVGSGTTTTGTQRVAVATDNTVTVAGSVSATLQGNSSVTLTAGSVSLAAGGNHVVVDSGTVTVNGSVSATLNNSSVSINGTVPVSGTFFQATQPVSGTISLSGNPTFSLGSSTLPVSQTGSPWPVVLEAGSASTPLGSATVYEGGTWNVGITGTPTFSLGASTVPVSLTGNSSVSLNASTQIVGKVGIDQTTPGATNRVSLSTDTVTMTPVYTGTYTSILGSATMGASSANVTTSAINLWTNGAPVEITLNMAIYNGSSSPSVGGSATVQVANSFAAPVWYNFGGPLNAGTTGSTTYPLNMEIPPGYRGLQIIYGGNTGQTTFISADINVVT